MNICSLVAFGTILLYWWLLVYVVARLYSETDTVFSMIKSTRGEGMALSIHSS
jgi:hypothetical protein